MWKPYPDNALSCWLFNVSTWLVLRRELCKGVLTFTWCALRHCPTKRLKLNWTSTGIQLMFHVEDIIKETTLFLYTELIRIVKKNVRLWFSTNSVWLLSLYSWTSMTEVWLIVCVAKERLFGWGLISVFCECNKLEVAGLQTSQNQKIRTELLMLAYIDCIL